MAYIPGKMLVHGLFLFAFLAGIAVCNEMNKTYDDGITMILTRGVRNETRQIEFNISNYNLITGGDDSEELDTFLRKILEEVYDILLETTLEPSSTSTVTTRITTQPTSTFTTSASTTTSTTLATAEPITTSSTLTTPTPTTLVTTQVVTSSTNISSPINATSVSATIVTSDVTSTSATTVTSDATSGSATTITSDATSILATTVTSDVTSAPATIVTSDATSATTVTSDATSATTLTSDATTEIATLITSSDTPTTDSTAQETEPSTITGETSATTFNTSSTSTLITTQFPVTTSPPPVTTSSPPVTTVSETPTTTSTQPPKTSSRPPAIIVTQTSFPTPSEHSTTASSQSPTSLSRSSTQATSTSPKTSHQTTTADQRTVEVTQQLNSLLNEVKDPTRLTVYQVKNYTTQVIGFHEYMLNNSEIAEKAVQVVGYLSSVNVSVSLQAETENRTNTRLREFLDSYTLDVDLEKSGGMVNITRQANRMIEIIVISTLYLNKTLRNGKLTFPITEEHENELNVTIILPNSIFDEGKNETRIQYIGYRRSQLFVPQHGFTMETSSLDHQRVVSVSVKDRNINNLTTPVEFILPKIEPGKTHSCRFWDIERWSKEGVTMVSEDYYSQTCHSSHLTSFSLLMDFGNIVEDEALTYLTYIGCGISIIGLSMTILTYSIFRCLNKEKAGKLLLNLCVALLLLNATFLAATVDVSSYSEISCIAIGMLLHYFLLASLAWMLVEAIELYQALVVVFRKYERRYMMKRCSLAWGAPAIIIAVTAAVSRQSYSMMQRDGKYCFLTNSNLAVFIGSVIGPSSLIMLANIFVFIMVTRVIFRENFQQTIKRKPSSITPTQIRGMFSVMFLLGATWVFGPLAFGDAQIIFNYLFCICNSLQGFLIFVFRCFFNSEAKQSWLQLLRTGTLKRRRGPVTAPVTDTTSKSGDRRHSNNTTNTTTSTSDSSHSEPKETTKCYLKSFSREQNEYKAIGCRFYSAMTNTQSKDFMANTPIVNSDTNYENTWTHL